MVSATTARGPQQVERRHDRVFYTGMSVAAIAAIARGFAPTYYLRGQHHLPALPLLVQVHGAIFSAWAVLFLCQTVLIAGRRTDVHRRVGVFGALLAAAMVAIGLATAIASARRNLANGNEGALAFLAIPLGDMLVFAILTASGILLRRRAEAHKRLMLLATIGILAAAIARWPLAILASGGPPVLFALNDSFILAGVLYDAVSRRRVHPAYLWGGLLIVGSQALKVAIWHTGPWLAFARMLAR